MKLPRDIGGTDLVRRLSQFGYVETRQTGSHVRLTRLTDAGQQHLTIPLHRPLRIGTLNSILSAVAEHLEVDKQGLLQQLFG